jgi:flagellar basal-body rod protein FlgF
VDRLIFTSLSGQKFIDQRVQQISNEIANVSTVGFKRAYAAATEAYRYDGDGFQSRFVSVVKPSTNVDMTAGPMMTTGRALDVALTGNQLFAVLTEKGELAYTRRGDLSVAADGSLRIGSGEQMASDAGGPINVPDLSEIKIGPDGTVFAKQVGGDAVVFQPIARLQVVEADRYQMLADENRINWRLLAPPRGRILDRFGEPLHDFPAFTASVCNLRPSSRGHVHLKGPDPFVAPAIQPN